MCSLFLAEAAATSACFSSFPCYSNEFLSCTIDFTRNNFTADGISEITYFFQDKTFKWLRKSLFKFYFKLSVGCPILRAILGELDLEWEKVDRNLIFPEKALWEALKIQNATF
jgi:hypothetical protein